MTSPTKADLQAAVTRLTGENAALRELLAAVRDCANTPAAPRGQFSAEEELDRQRLSHIRVWLQNKNFSDTRDVAGLTDLFRSHIAPVTYRPVCDEHITGTSPAALVYCQLDPGHDGDHSPEAPGPSGPPSAAEVYAGGSKGQRAADIPLCGLFPPDSAPGHCARLEGHTPPHRTLAGFEWGTPEADDGPESHYVPVGSGQRCGVRSPDGPGLIVYSCDAQSGHGGEHREHGKDGVGTLWIWPQDDAGAERADGGRM